MYVCKHVYTYVCMYVFIFLCMHVWIYICMATYIHIYVSMSHAQIEDKWGTWDCAALWTRFRPCSHATSRCMRIKFSSSTSVTLCTRWKMFSRPLSPCPRFGRMCSLMTRYTSALSKCAPFLLSTGTSFHQLSTASGTQFTFFTSTKVQLLTQ